MFLIFTLRKLGENTYIRPIGARFMHAREVRRYEQKQSRPSRRMKKPKRFSIRYDLSEYDLSGFKPAGFEFEAKDTQINMRLPASLLRAVRETARQRGIPYQRFIRQTLEHAVARPSPKAGKAR